ncbi:hypothetical protein FH972_024551 [Carpinus fangiana]|uniref:ABC transporter domain-containing protein n=1 Tax=Carpinus fangiana TaxID=176857 RepID=A0A5N6KZ88_9ROSI|nr:hypothetical protein FH972_024551 [Carpinus fangiana]
MAYTLNDDRLKAQVHKAAQYVLDNQQPDGWLGPENGTWRTFWGRYPLCLGLIGLAEANSTWEQPVLTAMYKFNDLMYTMMQNNYAGYIYHDGDKLDEGNFDWGRVRSQDMMISLMWLYDKHPKGSATQKKLLSNIKSLHDQGLNWENWYRQDTYTFDDLYDLPESITQNNYSFLHGVNVAQGLKAAAVVRRLTGNDDLITTASNGVKWTFQYHGAPSGTVTADERIDGLAPYSGAELCTAVEAMYSLSYLYQALGTNDYADRAELAAFNALPVSMTDDWWAHQYMAQPNQGYSRELPETPFYNTNNLGQTFGLEPNYPCCTVNHPQGLPKFVSNSYVLLGDSGLVHALLSPTSVTTTLPNGQKVTVKCDTNYPFADTLTYTVSTTGTFDFYIRAPAWATSSTLSGAQVDSTEDSSTGLHRIAFRGSTQGTTFTHTLQADVRTEARANDTISVYRGALLYALYIPSERSSTAPKDYQNKGFLPADYAPSQARDYTMQNTTAWNVAVDPSTLRYHAPAPDAALQSPAFAEGAPPNYITAQACEIAWPLFKGSVPGAAPPVSARKCLSKVYEGSGVGDRKVDGVFSRIGEEELEAAGEFDVEEDLSRLTSVPIRVKTRGRWEIARKKDETKRQSNIAHRWHVFLFSARSIITIASANLIAANGAGKTTLLRLLSGKRMDPSSSISVAGLDPFKDNLSGVTYLGVEWVLNPIVRTDIDVPRLLASVGGDAYPDRRDELVHILDIDTAWHMHAVSDGERRRVQLAMGLLRPWTVLLLDEITVDLDLLSRANFLAFLRRETESRACTVVYATHILDNLAEWPTHLAHMSLGRVKRTGTMESFAAERGEDAGHSGNSLLGDLVLKWLKEDLAERGPRSQSVRGGEGKTYPNLEGKGGFGQEKSRRGP